MGEFPNGTVIIDASGEFFSSDKNGREYKKVQGFSFALVGRLYAALRKVTLVTDLIAVFTALRKHFTIFHKFFCATKMVKIECLSAVCTSNNVRFFTIFFMRLILSIECFSVT